MLSLTNSYFVKAGEHSDDLSDRLRTLDITCEQSVYEPESSESSNGASESKHAEYMLAARREKLNEFLLISGKDPVKQSKKKWEYSSSRTKKDRITKAKDAVVSTLNVIAPDDPGSLWIGLKDSNSVERSLGLDSKEDKKFLSALAETYENAETWASQRQILSIMADLVPFAILERYIPGITHHKIKAARKHQAQYGRGVPVEVKRSPRMRVDDLQLDHFLSFITSPHVIQDLPFGQRYLHLSNGKVLETPNVIRSMIPQRIVTQYRQFCIENSFTPFSESTMLRILSSCSASVRKSLHGLDYFTADGAKAVDDLIGIVESLGDRGEKDRQWVQNCRQSLKKGKQYLKSDFKVSRLYIC